jgi:hypothetical protein
MYTVQIIHVFVGHCDTVEPGIFLQKLFRSGFLQGSSLKTRAHIMSTYEASCSGVSRVVLDVVQTRPVDTALVVNEIWSQLCGAANAQCTNTDKCRKSSAHPYR